MTRKSEDHCHCRCKKKLYFRCTSVGGVPGNYGQKCAPDHEYDHGSRLWKSVCKEDSGSGWQTEGTGRDIV